mmetsp:Transcript_13901/g.23054  ORF Transcript_13901/g.23054 Transcript_13901/m.23054 type:complete len:168 (-) Transcript_13901:1389-1892(-)
MGGSQPFEVYDTLQNIWQPLFAEDIDDNCYNTARIGTSMLAIGGNSQRMYTPSEGTSSVTTRNSTEVPTNAASDASKLLYMDAANFTGNFFKYKKPWSLASAQKEVLHFCQACTKSGWTLVVCLDQAIMTNEAMVKWRTRRGREVRKGERNVPQGALRLVGDIFSKY